MVFMSAFVECLKFLVETETHLDTMNHDYFWQVVRAIPAVAYMLRSNTADRKTESV